MAERRLDRGGVGYPQLRIGVQALAALLVLCLLWIGGPRLLRRLDFFQVRRVEIAGLKYLAPATVISTLAIDPAASVFDDLSAAGARLRALPGIVSAQVRRRLPGTLEIALVESTPVALAPGSDGMVLLDAFGKALPFDPAASAPDLPIAATVDALVARVLGQIQEHEPALFGRIEAAWRVRDDVLLDMEGQQIWFGATTTAEDIRAVMAVVQDLARRGRRYQELDGRFAGQVIVRRAGA